MLTQPRNRAQQLIYQKRSQDQKLSNLQTKLKQDFHQRQFANWQNKGQNLQIVSQMKLQMERMRQQSRINLQLRRKKLAMILQTENRQYEAEIIANQETPEQMRQRMAERVKVLKQQKQARRKQQVNAKLEKRFEQNADELRKVDQDLKQLKVAYERNLQMVEKQNILQNQYEQQMLFAELNRRDQKKKQELEKMKIAQQKEKVEERNAILAIQKELRNRKVNEQKEIDKIQKQMLKQQWQRQSQLEKLKQKHEFQKLRQAQRNIYEQNEKQKKIKEEQAKLQKQMDRQMIQRIVEKERQLAQYEKWMKQNEREEAIRVLSSVKNKNKQLAAYEKQLDRLIQIERLKKQKKQEQQWAKRQKARVNLMYDVFHDRQRKVREHQNERAVNLMQKQEDKIEVQRRIKEYQQEQERKRREQFEKNKKQQQKLLEQIALKEERRRMLLMQLQRQQQQLEKGRKQYGQKIQQRKERGRDQLETFKKTNRLF